MELQCDGTRDNSYAARTSKSRIPLTCMVLPSRAEYMRAKRPCQGAAITRSTSITHRIDTEFEHFRQLREMPREGIGVSAVASVERALEPDKGAACAVYPCCMYAGAPVPGK